jgi:hypothetical protein
MSQGFLFQSFQFARKFIDGNQHPAHPNEGAHNFYVDSDGARTTEHTGQHGDALLGKGVGGIAASAVIT